MEEVKNQLRIAFLQCDIQWESSDVNLQRFSQIISDAEGEFDLLVLPEMFHCGFTMNPNCVAQKMNGPVVGWMVELARSKQMAVVGSVVIEEDGNYFNRLLFVEPDGKMTAYNKRHLFRMAGEHDVYTAGDKQVVVEYKGWRIMPLVCYDLRFPVWSRNRNSYDLLLYVANWPTPRQEAWDLLLRARAIENQCYVLGVNRIGQDGQVGYSGGSVLVDPKGNVLMGGKGDVDTLFSANADLHVMQQFRTKFPVHLDADEFKLLQ